jgi:hypothetical protein
MKLTTALAMLLIAIPLSHAVAEAQTTPTASWPECKLGKAPISPVAPPAEATTFGAKGGPVVMSEAGTAGAVKLTRCRLPENTPSYRGADGVLRDVASNQPYWPVGWDAAPPAPTPTPTPTSPSLLAVIGIPKEVTVHVDGEVRHVHSGTVDLRHSGEIGLRKLPPLPSEYNKKVEGGKHHGLWWKIGVPVGIAVGTGFALKSRGHNNATPAGRQPGAIIGPEF